MLKVIRRKCPWISGIKNKLPQRIAFSEASVVGSLWDDSHWALPPDTHSTVWPPPLQYLAFDNTLWQHWGVSPSIIHFCLVSQLPIAFLVCVYFYEVTCHVGEAHLARHWRWPVTLSNEEKKLSFQKSLRNWIMPQPLNELGSISPVETLDETASKSRWADTLILAVRQKIQVCLDSWPTDTMRQ